MPCEEQVRAAAKRLVEEERAQKQEVPRQVCVQPVLQSKCSQYRDKPGFVGIVAELFQIKPLPPALGGGGGGSSSSSGSIEDSEQLAKVLSWYMGSDGLSNRMEMFVMHQEHQINEVWEADQGESK